MQIESHNVKFTIPHVSGIETLQKVQMGISALRFCKETGMCGAREERCSLCLSRLFTNRSHTGVIT